MKQRKNYLGYFTGVLAVCFLTVCLGIGGISVRAEETETAASEMTALQEAEDDGTFLADEPGDWDDGATVYSDSCYDEAGQELFGLLADEKEQQYYDEHPGRLEREDDSTDRYALLTADETLNQAAGRRLELAMEKGYLPDGTIPEGGTLEDELKRIPYRANASVMGFYLRDCDGAQEAFDKLSKKMERAYESGQDRKNKLEYYRYAGLSHKEKDGGHFFMVILMR